jgi:glutathione peroxidase-family protein
MKNLYKNEMVNFIISHKSQIVSGQELVGLYKNVAIKNGYEISQSHVPLNVHKFAKKYGQIIGKFKMNNGRISTIYKFNF